MLGWYLSEGEAEFKAWYNTKQGEWMTEVKSNLEVLIAAPFHSHVLFLYNHLLMRTTETARMTILLGIKIAR